VYEGAPTPITAFLSVASKAAGFVALVTLIYVAFPDASDVYQPFVWVLAAVSMTVGNLLALRQTNIVRMLAQTNFVKKGEADAIFLTRQGQAYVNNLKVFK
jgi:NADH-quinone oxidoreductase subunit N